VRQREGGGGERRRGQHEHQMMYLPRQGTVACGPIHVLEDGQGSQRLSRAAIPEHELVPRVRGIPATSRALLGRRAPTCATRTSPCPRAT
jgi:hypothetical protein